MLYIVLDVFIRFLIIYIFPLNLIIRIILTLCIAMSQLYTHCHATEVKLLIKGYNTAY